MPYIKKSDLVNLLSPTGKVHYGYLDFVDKKKVKIYQPYCNHRTWIGDYWGKRWVQTAKPVTCGNCLSAIRANTNCAFDEKLNNLGEEMRRAKGTLYDRFVKLSKECPSRKIVTSDMFSANEEEEYVFSCAHTQHDNSYEWWCHPTSCPLIGPERLTEINKPTKKEIEHYENFSRVKKDQTP